MLSKDVWNRQLYYWAMALNTSQEAVHTTHPGWGRAGGEEKLGGCIPGRGRGQRSAAAASQPWSLITFLPTGHHLFKSSTHPSSVLIETCSQVKAGSSPSCGLQDHWTLSPETSSVPLSLWCQRHFSAVPAERLRKSSFSERTGSLLLAIHLSIHPLVYPSNQPISISQRAWLLWRQNMLNARPARENLLMFHFRCVCVCIYVCICVCVCVCVCVCILSNSFVSDSLWPYRR